LLAAASPVAAAAQGAGPARSWDVRVREWWQAPARQDAATWRGVLRTADVLASPGALVAGPVVWALGAATDRAGVAEAGLRITESVVLAGALTQGTKWLAGRTRPSDSPTDASQWAFGRGFDGDRYQAFPSGHTSAIFAAATAVTLTVAERAPRATWPVALAVGTVATAGGVARMYLDRHWATDVIAGAAVGIGTAFGVAAWHRTSAGRALDRRLLGAQVTPFGVSIPFGGP
jgi:membrane-associated phospholipid phosphatase